MAQTSTTETLVTGVGKSLQSLDSLSELIAAAENLSKKGPVRPEHLAGIQRKVLLDSFTVKKFHRDYKEWEHSQKDQFLEKEVKPYNQKYGQMSRVYNDLERLDAALEELRKNTQIPTFNFSIQTIQQFENGLLLKRVPKNINGQYPSKVPVSQLFSLDAESNLPAPSFPIFNKLVNLEYRLRMLLHIKYEVLLRAKAHLSAKNTQWASRDAKLNLFLTRDFKAVYEEISKIKASEYEDLKYYEDDFEDEESEGEGEDQDEEVEENDENDENIDENIENIDENADEDLPDDVNTILEENGAGPLEENVENSLENAQNIENGQISENCHATESMDSEMVKPIEINLQKPSKDNSPVAPDVQNSTDIANDEKEDMELD